MTSWNDRGFVDIVDMITSRKIKPALRFQAGRMFASWTDQRQAQHSRVHMPAPRPWQYNIGFGPQDVAERRLRPATRAA